MPINLSQKVAVVTGGSKGIGAAVAKGLAAAGATTVVNYNSGKEDADRVVAEIGDAGGKAVALKADISKEAEIVALIEQVSSLYGKIDILVNNAGVARFGPIEAFTAADFQLQFSLNVFGPLTVIKESLKHFPPTGGSIINISSVGGQNPGPYTSVYTSTKAAINAVTISLSRELAGRNIRVNAVSPGPTDTEGSRSLGLAGSPIEAAMIAATPMGRFGKPAEIAPTVVFLTSEYASWITGENIAVSGGMR